MKKSLFSLSFVSLTHHCTQTSSFPTPNLQGIVLGTRLVPSILLGGFLLIVRAISFAIRSRVDNKLSEIVRFAIKCFHPLRMPSAGNASAKSGVCKVSRDFPANLNVAINVSIKIILTPVKVILCKTPCSPSHPIPRKSGKRRSVKLNVSSSKCHFFLVSET